MATPSLNFRNRAETGKTRFAQTVSRLVSARLRKFKAPSRAGTSTAKPLVCMLCQALACCLLLVACCLLLVAVCFAPRLAAYPPLRLHCDGGAVDALDGALNFCCREEKERRLFERSEFASSPSLRHKFKESFAISGAPFFAYFLWQDKESESGPAGRERGMDYQQKNHPHTKSISRQA